MKNEKSTMNITKIEDIERAAWFARLAFGIYPDKEVTHPAEIKRSEPAFHVMP